MIYSKCIYCLVLIFTLVSSIAVANDYDTVVQVKNVALLVSKKGNNIFFHYEKDRMTKELNIDLEINFLADFNGGQKEILSYIPSWTENCNTGFEGFSSRIVVSEEYIDRLRVILSLYNVSNPEIRVFELKNFRDIDSIKLKEVVLPKS